MFVARKVGPSRPSRDLLGITSFGFKGSKKIVVLFHFLHFSFLIYYLYLFNKNIHLILNTMISTTSKTVLYSIPIAVITLSSIFMFSVIRLDKNRDKNTNKRAKKSLGREKYNANSVASDPDYIIVGSSLP
jgi:hypothetical protein